MRAKLRAVADPRLERLRSVPLFGSCTEKELAFIASRADEVDIPAGRVLTEKGKSGGDFFIILEGSCSILVDGQERATLSRGEFFGEVSILLGESPVADVVAITPVRCLFLAGPSVESFLIGHPRVMYRMLQAQARRLRNANRWRS